MMVSATERMSLWWVDPRVIVATIDVPVPPTVQERRLEAWRRFCWGWDLHLTPDLLRLILPPKRPC